jgi:hypothetical protein
MLGIATLPGQGKSSVGTRPNDVPRLFPFAFALLLVEGVHAIRLLLPLDLEFLLADRHTESPAPE